ncbi:hypothetical protein CLAIMM_05230 [Cladophialophora immunda]|nr:hypothetical protein CLAIMM_05230 [Cladophialophora immunda]
MGPRQDTNARSGSTADADARSSKRRKMAHTQPASQPQAHGRVRTKEKRRASGGRRLGPHPPRDLRRLTGRPKPDSGLSTPQGTSDGEGKFTLSFAKSVLDKIWIRNKNQHRTQPWWKSLSMLRKAVSRLVLIEQEERTLRGLIGHGGVDAKDARERFERETQIRREKDVWVDWTRQVLVPKAYLGFSGLVSDTQFAHLGSVLVGLLADLVSSVGLPTPSQQEEVEQGRTVTTATRGGQSDTATAAKPRSLTAKNIRVTGSQSGEVVERTYESDDLGEVVERKRSGPKQEQELSKPTTRTRPDRATVRNPTLGGRRDQAAAAGTATDGVAGKYKPVEITKERRREDPSPAAEKSRAPSPSASAAASLAISQKNPATATTSQDSAGIPPPLHPPAPPSGLDATGTATVSKDQQKQKQTTTTAQTGAGKENTRNRSQPKRSNTKGKGKGKGKDVIDDLFAGLT